MIKKRNIIELIAVELLSILIAVGLFWFSILTVDGISKLESDVHYNIISLSAVISGFLFTGISVLVASIDKDRISRLWNCNYLDNLYHSAFLGILFLMLTLLFAFSVLYSHGAFFSFRIYLEIGCLISGFLYFGLCLKYLYLMISRLKEQLSDS